MKIALWRMLGVTAWIAVCLAVACNGGLQSSVRTGVPLVLTGLVLTFGRSVFPRPDRRDHVENEELLQKLSDLILLGIPAFFLLFFGFGILTLNILFAFMITVAILLLYSVCTFSP